MSTDIDGNATREAALLEVMADLAVAAAAATPMASGCALTTMGQGPGQGGLGPILAGSNAFAKAMESIQNQIGEGPSVTARATGRRVAVTDIRNDCTRWPVFAMVARAHELAGVHVEPLVTPGGRLCGAITWYARESMVLRRGAHGPNAQAAEVAATLAVAGRMLDLQIRPAQLPAALAAREVLAQAVGIVMERHRCDAEAAFAELCETTRRERALGKERS